MKAAKKLNGAMLSSIKSAEASLAKQEIRDLEAGIPDGHPLKDEAERQKALIGDLGDLPAGHPLIKMMQAAKERYEQQQSQKNEEQGAAADVRRARKVNEENAKREARRVEDEQSEKRIGAAKQVNSGIDVTLTAVRGLYRTMSDYEEILNTDPYSRARIGRLKRLLFAAERGLSECKIARI